MHLYSVSPSMPIHDSCFVYIWMEVCVYKICLARATHLMHFRCTIPCAAYYQGLLLHRHFNSAMQLSLHSTLDVGSGCTFRSNNPYMAESAMTTATTPINSYQVLAGGIEICAWFNVYFKASLKSAVPASGQFSVFLPRLAFQRNFALADSFCLAHVVYCMFAVDAFPVDVTVCAFKYLCEIFNVCGNKCVLAFSLVLMHSANTDLCVYKYFYIFRR